jgi:hypothetical protein
MTLMGSWGTRGTWGTWGAWGTWGMWGGIALKSTLNSPVTY